MAQRNYDSFSSRRNASRYDIEALYQARSFNAERGTVPADGQSDRRSDGELQGHTWLSFKSSLRGSGRYSFDRRYWSDIQRTSDDLARELNIGTTRSQMTIARLGTIQVAALPDGCAGAG